MRLLLWSSFVAALLVTEPANAEEATETAPSLPASYKWAGTRLSIGVTPSIWFEAPVAADGDASAHIGAGLDAALLWVAPQEPWYASGGVRGFLHSGNDAPGAAVGGHALLGLRAGSRIAFGAGLELGARFHPLANAADLDTVILPGFYAVPFLQLPRLNFGQFAFVLEPGLLLQRIDDRRGPQPRERFTLVGGRIMTWLALSFPRTGF